MMITKAGDHDLPHVKASQMTALGQGLAMIRKVQGQIMSMVDVGNQSEIITVEDGKGITMGSMADKTAWDMAKVSQGNFRFVSIPLT